MRGDGGAGKVAAPPGQDETASKEHSDRNPETAVFPI